MKKIVCLIIVLFLTGCGGTMHSLPFKDTHPELNRPFRLGIDTPGDYPYCRQYEEESELQNQMYGN